MKQIETVLIAGAGAVGLTVASSLFEWNAKGVYILAKKDRLAKYKSNGLFVNNQKIPFLFADAEKQDCKPDLIIIACKYHHLNEILDDIKNYVGKETLILSLLNGISSEEIIGKRYSSERIPYAMILGTDAQHSGTQTEVHVKGTIFFGEKLNPSVDGKATEECSENVRRIAEFFERAKVSYSIPQNMIRKLWFKFMVNVGINQTSAILKFPYGPFQDNGKPFNMPEARELMTNVMKEVIAVSKPAGVNLSDDDLSEWYECLDSLPAESCTSMCQDIKACRKTEVEMFAETIIKLGKQYDVPTPINYVFYNQIRMLEKSFKR